MWELRVLVPLFLSSSFTVNNPPTVSRILYLPRASRTNNKRMSKYSLQKDLDLITNVMFQSLFLSDWKTTTWLDTSSLELCCQNRRLEKSHKVSITCSLMTQKLPLVVLLPLEHHRDLFCSCLSEYKYVFKQVKNNLSHDISSTMTVLTLIQQNSSVCLVKILSSNTGKQDELQKLGN